MPEPPVSVARAFVAAINAGDVAALRALMTNDHTFTDALGHSFSGAETMISGWQFFFRAFPEYWIRVDTCFADGDRVALFGEAGGRWRVDGQVLPGSWKTAAAWLAEVRDGRVKHWRVFCDTAWASAPRPEG